MKKEEIEEVVSAVVSAVVRNTEVIPTYSIKQVCKLLNVSDQTVRNYVKSGKLKYLHADSSPLRFRAVDINNFLEGK